MMQIFHSTDDIRAFARERSAAGGGVGFVPTMGALHQGHMALVRQARQGNATVVASVFVNPTQFNNADDYRLYPRDLEADARLLADAGCDALFAPTEADIYPEPDTRQFDLGSLAQVLEGEFRPGHFNGVVQVVSRLLDIVAPDRAYFGQKDYQQLAILRHMLPRLGYGCQIVPVPIVRDADGLALSSRNQRLTPAQRASAPHIYRTMQQVRGMRGQGTPAQAEAEITRRLNAGNEMRVEYFRIVDPVSLQAAESWPTGQLLACAAVYCGQVRLIDNLLF